jgi:hypothetical protein
MEDFHFRTPTETWVRITADVGDVTVTYQPEFRRAGMTIEVLDYFGLVIDTHDLLASYPEKSEIEIAHIEVPDGPVAARWIAVHVAGGMVALDEVESLVDADGCHPLNGADYHVDGVGGRLEMNPEPSLYTREGEDIPLTEEDLARLQPIGPGVHSIARVEV